MKTFLQYLTEYAQNDSYNDLPHLAKHYGYVPSKHVTSPNHTVYVHPLGNSIHKFIDPQKHTSTWIHYNPQGRVLDRGEYNAAPRDLADSLKHAHPKGNTPVPMRGHHPDDF